MADRSVICTGATGSFGNAFVRRCLADGARRIVVFSRDELKQAEMRAALGDDPRLRFFLGDIRQPDRIVQAMRDVELCVHAAAMKRIESCEENPREAKRTNVDGTEHVADACIAAGVQRAVMLSTDKAPNAATFYGATKFLAERAWVGSNVLAAGTPTRFSAVRYGNVLGSRGSVLDLFRQQLDQGEGVTVTDERMTRFWMTIGQAVDLVMLALSTMRGGEVLVPKAPAAPVLTLVGALATSDYRTVEIGLRPAERLHETLIASDEARNTYDAGSHYVIEPERRTWAEHIDEETGSVATLPKLRYPKVPDDFEYRSDNNPDQLTVEGMRELVA